VKILVLGGAGDIGSGIAEALCSSPIDRVVVGDINYPKARFVAEFLKSRGCNVEAVKVNALDMNSLRDASSDVDVVVNSVGPFYKYGYEIAKNIVSLGLNFVDVCDDYDAVEKILGLNEEAARRGVLGVVGFGWTPGLSNILALHASSELREVDSIDIYWVGSAADSRGLAVVMHLFHSLIGKVPMYINGSRVYVEAGSGAVAVEFPKPIGRVKLYYTGHPEPITLPKYVNVRNRVTVRGGLVPPWQSDLAKLLLRLFRVKDDKGVERLSKLVYRIEDVFRWGGLQLSAVRVDVTGYSRTISLVAMDRMRRLTGIPAALAAIMIASGELSDKGVKPPEAVIKDTGEFLRKLSDKGINVVKM